MITRYCTEDGSKIDFEDEEPRECPTCHNWYIPKLQGICLSDPPKGLQADETQDSLILDWPGKNPDPLLPKITLKEPRL